MPSGGANCEFVDTLLLLVLFGTSENRKGDAVVDCSTGNAVDIRKIN